MVLRDHVFCLFPHPGVAYTFCSEMDNASMGSADTLGSFLRWGQENYYADRNILVLWDHGGSSSEGVCYDENYGYDFLSRGELVEAFDMAQLPEKLDLICLDTCYMGSLAIASLFSDYARYMTASQTIVPGPGLDYRVLAEEACGTDLKAFGRILCDTFMDRCEDTGRADEAQLSFFDLDRSDAMIEAVDNAAVTLKAAYESTGDSYEIFRGAQEARVSATSSTSNVIDLIHFVNAMSFLDWVNHKETIQSLMDELIPYQVCGVYADLNGASIYYPLNYNEAQLEEYVRLSAAPNYSTLLHEIYADLPEELILFQDRGSIGESGSFDMELEESSLQYVRSITMRTWREREDIPGKYALLGDSEVDTYVTELERKLARPGVSCQLSGEAYALDGHFLLPGVSGMRLTQFYTSPVQVNGEDTSYIFVVAQSLFRHIHKIIYTMIGSLVDENGLPSRVIGHLKRGDRISIYSATDETGENLVLQDEFVVKEDDIWPELDPLPEGQNRCQYIVTDIIGRTVSSDYGIFEIGEEDGERTVQLKEIVKTLSEE